MLIEFRVNKLAELLGVHRNTITNWIKSGKLKAVPSVAKRYLVKRDDIVCLFNEEGVSVELIDKLKITNGFDHKKKPKLKNKTKDNVDVTETQKKKPYINLLVV